MSCVNYIIEKKQTSVDSQSIFFEKICIVIGLVIFYWNKLNVEVSSSKQILQTYESKDKYVFKEGFHDI